MTKAFLLLAGVLFLLASVLTTDLVLADGESARGGPLRVGWAMADLTPEVPVHMAGMGSLRVSEGVMDPITATVLVLESVGEEEAGRDMLILAGSAYGAVPESIVFGPEGGRELVEATLELIESLWEE